MDWRTVAIFGGDALWITLGLYYYRKGKKKTALFWGGLGLVWLAWDLVRFL